MRNLKIAGFLALTLLTGFVLSLRASTDATAINFSSLDTSQPHNVSGTLYMPVNCSGPCPAVVLIHGTNGIDQRGELYREPILSAGIAIFEVDFKTGIYKGPTDRPSPDAFLPMAFAALKQLRKLPSIDPERIGIMGFSLGGNISLRTAIESNVKEWMGNDKGFIAFATFYPVSKPIIKELEKKGTKLTGGPIIVFYGTNDSYGEGTAVPELKSLLATKFNFQLITVEYAGATHAFNLNAPDMNYFDPAAIHMRGHTSWDPEAANDSIPKLVAFLRENVAGK
ncbi:MAG TPA: dienelactone hydrolase family protein [Candidatus Acidoferrum sp.]|nr:dienelactone hydrolase family protein [Candidatus Acidoferrum sp.]